MRSDGMLNPPVNVEGCILSIRGQRVILDSDLANLYGVSTKRLNEQVRRNIGFLRISCSSCRPMRPPL
jgi:hypothetical protein